MNRLFVFLPVPVRVLIVKDVRTFCRDPVQFLQLLIFTGLVGFYITATSRMNFYTDSTYWRNMASFLNLTVMALFLTVFASRFIFPQLSLEGQKMWILGLCPIRRDTILWSKFCFSSAGAVLLTTTLTLLGILLLHPDSLLIALQFVMIPILCCGVSGIAVGLGARFIDSKQTDPSRIASSLAGTLNLVVCLFFIFSVIAAVAIPCHMYALTESNDLIDSAGAGNDRVRIELPENLFELWLIGGIGFSVVLGLVATLLPMRIGLKAFRKMEI